MLPFFHKKGVQFDSRNLLCKTGGKVAQFAPKCLVMQCDFPSDSFFIVPSRGNCCPIFSQKIGRAI